MVEPLAESKPESARAFVLVALLVVAILVAYGFVVTYAITDWVQRGQFGDMFGAANTLFSGLAFAALTYALFLQRKELSLQRVELALTRVELSKQSEAQSQQAETALRAAKINAYGSLFQAYGQFLSFQAHDLIAPGDWHSEILRVKKHLTDLMKA